MLQKIELEYEMMTSPQVLFPFLCTEIGLSEWFADKVSIDGKYYTFLIDNEERKAELKEFSDNYLIRFNWVGCPDNSYLEFRIKIDDLTNDLDLLITDFAEASEKEEIIRIWNLQLTNLKHLIGL